MVLAVVGYFVQRQLVSEGLKKDYVQIATSILKESPKAQDPELRKWAVEVLDRNADIPFSDKAKASLEKGFPPVRSQFIFPDAPKPCMEAPNENKLHSLIRVSIKNGYADVGDQKQFLLKLSDEAFKADTHASRLKCLQDWIESVKKVTEETNAKQYGLTPTGTLESGDAKPAKR